MTDMRWIVAAIAGALWVAPVGAQTGSSSRDTTAGDTAAGSSGARQHATPDHPTNNSEVSQPPSASDRAATGTGSASATESTSNDTGARQHATPDHPTNNSEVSQPPSTSDRTGAAASTRDTATTGTASAVHGAAHADLLQRLHAGNQAEIQAGQWMQQHAQNSKVKDFAKKMVKDHQDMDKDVQKFAQKEGVSLTGGASSDPTAAQDQEHMQAMKSMPAAQADRHYMTMMVNDHQRDVSEVRSAADQAKSANDKDLAKLLDKTAKKMEDHLKDAQKIQRDMGSRQARTPSSQ